MFSVSGLGSGKGVTPASFLIPRADEKIMFLSHFWLIFPPGGTPRGSLAPLGAQVGSQIDFLMLFRHPWGGFGTPFGLFVFPWGVLGLHLGAQSGHKSAKKTGPGAQCAPQAILDAKREGPGPVQCGENTVNTMVLV